MNIFKISNIVAIFILLFANYSYAQSGSFGEYKNYAFPTELTSAAIGGKIAWAIDAAGRRNVYVAEAPDFKPRKLTNYSEDDGQEITSLSISIPGANSGEDIGISILSFLVCFLKTSSEI